MRDGMKAKLLSGMRAGLSLALLGLVVPLTGCPFFVCQKASCTDNTTGTTGTGDWVFVSNSASGTNYISVYTVGTDSLTPVSGSPFAISFEPVAMAVSTNDQFLYVAAPAGSSAPGLWSYSISSTGTLSGATQQNSNLIGAMAVSPDGNYLYTVDTTTGSVLQQYSLNASTGAATIGPQGAAPNGNGCQFVSTPISQECSIAVSPQENYVALSMGQAGTAVFPYSSTGGGLTASSPLFTISPGSSTNGQYSVGFDDSGYMYVAGTSTVTPYYSFTSTGASIGTAVTNNGTPRSVALSPSYGFLFTADEGTSKISTYLVSSGLTETTSSPQAGPTGVSVVGVDRSGTYLLAAGYNGSTGLSMYTFGSTGLSASPVATEGTGTSETVPVVMAFSH